MKSRERGARAIAALGAAGIAVALAFAAGARGDDVPAGDGAGICYDCAPPVACEDGRDNDADGKIDYPADPGCTDAGDPDETDPGVPPPPPPPPPGGSAECADGLDNDGDGLVDLDDITGCTSAGDPDEGDDVYDPGDPGYAYYRYDEPVPLDGGTPCAWLGAYRDRHGVHGRLWKLNVLAHFCWNGRVVTRIDNVHPWLETAPFPVNLAFPVEWRLEAAIQGASGLTVTTVFHQANIKVCPLKLKFPRCLTDEHPWIRFVLFGNGSALCQTDTGPVDSTDCRSPG